MNKDEVGRAGEELAAEMLSSHGYQILARNWRGAAALRNSGERRNHGELDIVARQGNTLVGIEVKTRTSEAFGSPVAAITPDKVARLKRLLAQWLTEHRRITDAVPMVDPKEATSLQRGFGRPTDVRLDAVGVLLPDPEHNSLVTPEITLYQGIS